MAKSREPEPSPDGVFLPRLAPAVKEAAFWLTAALAVVLAVALASFHPGDPSFTTSSGAGAVRNLIGPAGAWTSDVLLFVLGASAYALPLLVAYCGWLIFRGLNRRSNWVRLTRLAALLVALLALSTLLALVASPGPGWLPAGIGGVMIAVIQSPTPTVGFAFTLKAFAIVVLAGLGNIRGILWASLAVAVSESLVATLVPNGDALRNAVFFAIIFVVLVVRARRTA